MREARLRPEYAELYPELVPGQWEPAARIAEVVLARYLLQQLTDGQPDRALNETHFEFRGGGAERAGDRDAAPRRRLTPRRPLKPDDLVGQERVTPLEMSPEEFRRLGHELVDRIAEFLGDAARPTR